MAKSCRQYIFEALELIPDGLIAFVEKRLSSTINNWKSELKYKNPHINISNDKISWDQSSLLKAINDFWMDSFKDVLGRTERSYVNEIIDARNKHAHNENFSYSDTERAIDTIKRLMEAVCSNQIATKLESLRTEVLKIQFTEKTRNEERKKIKSVNENLFSPTINAKSWREVVSPHEDVATGQFNQSEFAANLATVHDGRGSKEYSDPYAFFQRTFLTGGLKNLLKNAYEKIVLNKGDPIIQLQTNFGGGKTHSLLALYHLFNGANLKDLPGLDQIITDNFEENVGKAVLVGTARGPLEPVKKENITINTTWGELAYQIGGLEAYKDMEKQDKQGIAPGSDHLRQLFNKFSPCMILIDEWVAYLRQIYNVDDLPSGSFDANLSFVQSLTEAVKDSPNTLLVASLPASQIEVGGDGGQAALDRLSTTFSRMDSTWQAATQDESYEIVRKRLFNEIDGESIAHRDNTIKQFLKLYKEYSEDFPEFVNTPDYKKKLELSYPIHPELFDKLYNVWGGIDKFQRTRGILRFMSEVVHELWNSNSSDLLLMPSCINIASPNIQPELTKYLSSGWPSIISEDIDGLQSTAYNLDSRYQTLGKHSVCKRLSRALFMGTSPLSEADEIKGINLKEINLGTIQAGENPSHFQDGLTRLANNSKHLHQDLGLYKYKTAPSLNKLATDLASQLSDDEIKDELTSRLKLQLDSLDKDVFKYIHPLISNSYDVPDDYGDSRLVFLNIDSSHSRNQKDSKALHKAKDILDNCGDSPREFKNCLIFLSADNSMMETLKDSYKQNLAWNKILEDRDVYNLNQSDIRHTEKKIKNSEEQFISLTNDLWKWLIVPNQQSPNEDIELNPLKINTSIDFFFSIKQKLVSEGLVAEKLGPNVYNTLLEKYFWKENDHLVISDLLKYHSKLIYFPRLLSPNVLKGTIQQTISELIDGNFAYAEAYDNENKYSGLVGKNSPQKEILINGQDVIVKKSIYEKYKNTDDTDEEKPPQRQPGDDVQKKKTQYSGTVFLNNQTHARDYSKISENIIDHLKSMEDVDITIKVEINATVPNGIDEQKERTLLQNSSDLEFDEKKID